MKNNLKAFLSIDVAYFAEIILLFSPRGMPILILSKTSGRYRLMKNCKIYLISVLLFISCFVFSNCSGTESKSIILHDYRFNDKDTLITLELKLGDRIYKQKISSHTKRIKILKDSELFSVEHNSSFCAKIVLSDNSIDIYVFPNDIVKDIYDSYVVSDANDVYAFFIECYDDVSEKNYYIFSKDNIINKKAEFNHATDWLESLQVLQDNDIACYNDDVQPLSYPYAGYVIKNRDGNFLLLSTLWENCTIN